MHSKQELIEALGLVKEKFSRMTTCPLCPQEVHIRQIKRHLLKNHRFKNVTRAMVNELTETDQKLYRAVNNRKKRFSCQFCNEAFDRISLWLTHLSSFHKIMLAGRIGMIIDIHVAALQTETDNQPDVRRRLVIESPQEAASL